MKQDASGNGDNSRRAGVRRVVWICVAIAFAVYLAVIVKSVLSG